MVFYTKENGEKKYYLFVRQGENNVYDMNNVRAKDWYFEGCGIEKELWKRIGVRAGCVEGGSLQKSLGWTKTEEYTIEEYIKQYRSKIKNAKPLETFF